MKPNERVLDLVGRVLGEETVQLGVEVTGHQAVLQLLCLLGVYSAVVIGYSI